VDLVFCWEGSLPVQAWGASSRAVGNDRCPWCVQRVSGRDGLPGLVFPAQMCPLEYAELSAACAGMPLKGKLKWTPPWLWESGRVAVIYAEVQAGFEVSAFISLPLSLPRRAYWKGKAGRPQPQAPCTVELLLTGSLGLCEDADLINDICRNHCGSGAFSGEHSF